MEPFTSGKVSAAARRCYVASNPRMVDAFTPVSGGYRMIAWASQIAMARAMGRGDAAGRERLVHPFDRRS